MSTAARTRSRCASRTAWSGAKGILDRRPVRPPPEVGQRVDRVIGTDDQRRVLLAVAGSQPQLGVGGEVPAVAVMVEPEIAAVLRPEIDDPGIREQPGVQRVIGVVMTEEDVGHVLRPDAPRGERVEDRGVRRAQPGVRDDDRVAVPDERDAAANVALVADVAGWMSSTVVVIGAG